MLPRAILAVIEIIDQFHSQFSLNKTYTLDLKRLPSVGFNSLILHPFI